MTNIAELYAQLKITDNDILAQASSDILSLYQDPNTISQILAVLLNHNDIFIRHNATLGLKTLLHNFWYEYSHSPCAGQIMENIITYLQNESVELVRHSAIFALEPICSYRESVWPRQLDDLALTCIQSEDPAVLDVGLSLYEIIVPHLDDSTVVSVLPLISERIEYIFNTKPMLIVNAAKVLASLMKVFNPPIPDSLDHLLYILLDGFKSLLLCQAPIIFEITSAIDDAISGGNVVNPQKILVFLYQLSMDPLTPRNLLCHVFTLIQTIINFNFSRVEKCMLLIIGATFKCAALTFQDVCLDEQTDSWYIINTLYSMPYNDEDFAEFLSKALSQFISSSSIQDSFASLLTILFFIDEFPLFVSDNFKLMISFVLQQTDINNHHCLRELAMTCFTHLIFVFNGGVARYSDSIMQATMNSISCDHDPLIVEGLATLTNHVTNLKFDHIVLSNLVQIIISKLGRSPDILYRGLMALNAVIFAVCSEIQPFSHQLYVIFLRVIQVDEINNPVLKSSASQGLARLLKCETSSDNAQEFAETAITMLMNCATSEDLTVLQSAFDAFAILADANFPQIVPALQIVMQRSLEILGLDYPIEDDESEIDNNDVNYGVYDNCIRSPVIEAKHSAIKFIGSFAKARPEMIAVCAETFVELLLAVLETQHLEMMLFSLQTLASMASRNLTNSNVIVPKILAFIKKEKITPFVWTGFVALKKMINSQTAPEIATECVKFAVAGMMDMLPCQRVDNDFILLQKLYKFLEKIALCFPCLFPLDVVLKVMHQYSQKGKDDALSCATMPLAKYLSIVSNSVPVETRQAIYSILFDSLTICDATVIPLPIDAFNILLNSNYELCGSPQVVQQILEKLHVICSLPNNGQPTYEKTVSSVLSLLFSIFNIMGDKFDVQSFLPFMLEPLPMPYKKNAKNIYSCLIQIYNKFPQLLGQFAPQLIIALSKTLALCDSALASMGLSIETIRQLLVILNISISSVPNSHQIIVETIKDPNALNRLMTKVN